MAVVVHFSCEQFVSICVFLQPAHCFTLWGFIFSQRIVSHFLFQPAEPFLALLAKQRHPDWSFLKVSMRELNAVLKPKRKRRTKKKFKAKSLFSCLLLLSYLDLFRGLVLSFLFCNTSWSHKYFNNKHLWFEIKLFYKPMIWLRGTWSLSILW